MILVCFIVRVKEQLFASKVPVAKPPSLTSAFLQTNLFFFATKLPTGMVKVYELRVAATLTSARFTFVYLTAMAALTDNLSLPLVTVNLSILKVFLTPSISFIGAGFRPLTILSPAWAAPDELPVVIRIVTGQDKPERSIFLAVKEKLPVAGTYLKDFFALPSVEEELYLPFLNELPSIGNVFVHSVSKSFESTVIAMLFASLRLLALTSIMPEIEIVPILFLPAETVHFVIETQ